MTETIKCGLCHNEFEPGAQVCQGCHGYIVYGATNSERVEGFKTGFLLWGIISLLIIYGAPALINQQFDWGIPFAFGLSAWGMVPVVVAAIFGGSRGSSLARNAKSGLVRTFRKID